MRDDGTFLKSICGLQSLIGRLGPIVACYNEWQPQLIWGSFFKGFFSTQREHLSGDIRDNKREGFVFSYVAYFSHIVIRDYFF